MYDSLLESFWQSPSWQPASNYLGDPSVAVLQYFDPDQPIGVESSIQPNIESPLESTNTIANQQRGEAPRRVNNTVFKTGVSCYRKSLVEYVKRSPNLKSLQEDINEACEGKNMSVFPKLNFMVRWLGLSEVAEIWAKRKEEVLEEKKKKNAEGKYALERLNELAQVIKKMDECIKDEEFDRVIERYWGKFRQHSKHLTCKENVFHFCKEFEKANPDKKIGKKQQKKKEAKKTRKTKKTTKKPKPKKTRKTNIIKKAKPIKKTEKNTGN